MPVEYVELAFHFHRIAVDRIFELLRRIGVEMAKAAAQIGGRAHLPEKPAHHLGFLCGIGGHECAKFFREIEHDRPAFEHPLRGVAGVVHERRDLGVGVYLHKARAELVTFANVDQPCVIFRA